MPARRRTDIGARVRSVESAGDYAKALVFAENKVGKTTFAASAPNCFLIQVGIDADGHYSVKGKGTGAQFINVSSWPEIVETYWWLRDNRKEFESVAIDTLTAMVALAMRHALQVADKRDPNRLPMTPDQRAWGKVKELMLPQLLQFRNLPMHVVFTAQEKRWFSDDGELEAIVPDIPGASLGIAMGAVGAVGRLSKVKPKTQAARKKRWPRVLLVGDHEIVKTGNRVGLPRVIRNPTMKPIIDAYAA